MLVQVFAKEKARPFQGSIEDIFRYKVGMGYISLYFLFLFFVSGFNLGYGSGSWKSLDLIIDINGTCGRLLYNFSLAASNFTYCSITNARPITFCEKCVRNYLDVLKYHEEILTVQDRGVKCKDALINVDRLEIIETLYSSFVQLWKKGECDYCFEIEPNGTTTYTPNNSTINFHTIENSVRECIKKNMEKNSTVCTLCREPYKKLNDFYNSLKQSSRVCMDIVDSMNASRMEWSKDLGCKVHFEMDPYLITTAVLFTFIPSIFYGLVKKYSSRVESRLLYQNRLAGQFYAPQVSQDSR